MALHPPREPFNAWSHAVGLVSFVGAGVGLLTLAPSALAKLGAGIYLVAAALLFAASAVYHWVHPRTDWPQRLDHMAIYLMIAGTYVPVCLLALPREKGLMMLGIQGGLVALGIGLNLLLKGGPHWMRLVIYLAQGWAAALILADLRAQMDALAFSLLVAGGVLYTAGIVFYATDRRVWPGRRSGHEVWHVIVLVAALAHFGMVWRVVVQA